MENITVTGSLELETESGLWLGYLFKGKLAQVWIFNVSLSVDEVNDVKDANKPPTSSKFKITTFINFINGVSAKLINITINTELVICYINQY